MIIIFKGGIYPDPEPREDGKIGKILLHSTYGKPFVLDGIKLLVTLQSKVTNIAT